MNGPDKALIDFFECPLNAPQCRAIRIFGTRFQRAEKPPAHFPRGLARKGDRRQLIDRDHAGLHGIDHPFHQLMGFPRPRACEDHHILIQRVGYGIACSLISKCHKAIRGSWEDGS